MKHFRFLIIAAVAAMFGACQTEPADNGPIAEGSKEVRIACSIKGSRVGTEINMQKSFFEEGDRIALTVMRRPIYQETPKVPTYDRRGESDFYLHNAIMIFEDGKWVFDQDYKIILEEGYRYDYYAYYPGWAETSRDPQTMEYSASATTSSDFVPHSDLLWAKFATTNPDDYDKLEIDLQFEHLVSMVEVRQVGLGKNATVKLKSDQQIVLNGAFDLGTGVFTTAPAEGIETKIKDSGAANGYRIIAQKTAREVNFIPMSNGRYVLFLPPQSLKANFKTVIETMPDPDVPSILYKYELKENDGNGNWELKQGQSMARTYDFKLMEADEATGLKQYETLLYTPNSILLSSSGQQYSVPIGKAYAMWLYDNNLNGGSPDFESLYGELSLKMLWADTPDFAQKVVVRIDDTSKGAKARLMARIDGSEAYEGNAVYGLYINDELRWSWHIWANSVQNPAAGQGVVGDYRFMRSNLGAWSSRNNAGGMRGLVYQWGRKDPFPAADNTGWDFTAYQPIYNEAGEQINAGSGYMYGIKIAPHNDIRSSVTMPDTFFLTWNPISATNLWDVPYVGGTPYTDKKSPYDPCPLGWRIPRTETNTAWYLAGAGEDLSNYTANTTWNNGVILNLNDQYMPGSFPQTNYRNISGEISTAESTSELWHGGADGNSLWISNSTTAPNIKLNGQDALARGKAVRCMRDTRDVQTW